MMRVKTVLEAYRKHVEERAAQGVVPQPLNAEQTAGLVELLKIEVTQPVMDAPSMPQSC